jgi:GT2 family glycosyltransferase
VIIVGWNNYDNTRECLQSILNQQQIGTEIFLVDNGSKTEPLDNLSLLFPEINYIYSEKNLGFAAGTNLGLQKALSAGYNYFLIINNDTRADLLMLSELVKPLKDENVGLVAPFIYYYDNPDKVWSCGGFINNVLLMPLDSHNVKKAVFNPTERTFLSGCCYLMRRELLEQVGLFDERFFLYFEDLDYCKRVVQSRWKMMAIPTAKLFHKVSQSSGGQFSESERFHYAKSSGLYFRKHMNKFNALPIILFRLGSALKMVIYLFMSGKSKVMQSYLCGLYQGWFHKSNKSAMEKNDST